MLGASPLPYQNTAGFDLSHRPESGDRPPCASVFGYAFEQAAGGNAEPAAQAFLDAVGNGALEQIPPKPPRRRTAIERLPLRFQLRNIESVEA